MKLKRPIWIPPTALGCLLLTLASPTATPETDAPVRMQIEQGHARTVRSVAFSPDGRTVAAGSGLWSTDGRLLRTLTTSRSGFQSVAFSPDGRVIIGSWGDTVELWNTDGHMLWGRRDAGDRSRDGSLIVYSVVFSPDGRTIASGSSHGMVRLWSTDGRLLRTLTVSRKTVRSVAFSPDGRAIALGTWDGSVQLWSTDGRLLWGRHLGYTSGRDNIWVQSVAFSPDGRTIVSGSADGTVRLWSTDGRLLRTLTGHTNEVSSVAFSPDGRTVASGSVDGTVRLWSPDGRLLRTLTGHTNEVSSVAFSPDGRTIASGGSEDRSMRVWNRQSGHSLAFIAFHTGDWFIKDDKGRFVTSATGRKYITFVQGLTYYQSDQFWDRFYTPDLVRVFFAGRTLPPVDIKQAVAAAPDVKVSGPDPDSTLTARELSIRVQARPGNNGLGDVFLYHNGRPVTEETRGIVVKQVGADRVFTVELLPGENVFVGAAFDHSRGSEGRSRSLTVFYKPREIVRPDLYILAVGVAVYKDSNINTPYADKDAKVLAALWKEKAAGLYRNVHTTVLTNNLGTRANMRAAMAKLEKTQAWDTVILFFAGHGDVEKGKYYFLPHEVDITNLPGTAFGSDELQRALKKLGANKQAVFLDTCKSGSAVKTVAYARSIAETQIIARLAKERGIAVFSAASPDQRSFGVRALGHGLFSYAMIQALEKDTGRITKDRLISIVQLLGAVKARTESLAREHLGREQNPLIYLFGSDFALGRAH